MEAKSPRHDLFCWLMASNALAEVKDRLSLRDIILSFW